MKSLSNVAPFSTVTCKHYEVIFDCSPAAARRMHSGDLKDMRKFFKRPLKRVTFWHLATFIGCTVEDLLK